MVEKVKDLQLQETQKQELMEDEAERTRDRTVFVPRVDIYESDKTVVAVADMPGVDETSVDITVEKNVLTLKGYVEPEPLEGYALAYAEYQVGDYERSFTLSNEIEQDKIEATVKDGVLRIFLPKAAPMTKKISVKGA